MKDQLITRIPNILPIPPLNRPNNNHTDYFEIKTEANTYSLYTAILKEFDQDSQLKPITEAIPGFS